MTNIKEQLMCKLADVPYSGCGKITIVGAGHVGMACAVSILSKGISSEICLIDIDESKVCGEVLDLQHASSFIQNAKITGGTDLDMSCCSRIYIIAAGAENLSRQELIEKNTPIIKDVVPKAVQISPYCIIVVVTNPVDIMTHLAWKLSRLPKNRVFGSGTSVDSARFRFLIADRLNIAPSSVDACIIGEHGESSVAVWSAVSVAGVNLRDIDGCIGVAEDADGWHSVHEEVIKAPSDILSLKGNTKWAIGLSVSNIVEAILTNSGVAMPVSTGIKGLYGIEKDVFLSMPCTINSNGITSVLKLNLTPFEVEQLQKSAEILAEAFQIENVDNLGTEDNKCEKRPSEEVK